MNSRIATLHEDMMTDLQGAKSSEAVKDVEVKYFGKNGFFNDVMRGLKDLSDDEKHTVGKAANDAKKELEQAVIDHLQTVEMARFESIADDEWMDVTVPGVPPRVGHRHLISRFIDELEGIFSKMGFRVAEGPEMEEEHYNFNQLNIPDDHPARDMQDTFWLKDLPHRLLRTHTSPTQVHYMEAHQPPVRIISMGKVYRKDSDATHSPMFHQIEGLMVDENVSMANLKAVMTHSLQQIFGDDSIKTRFRVSFFPFVEPGMEVDCTCPICLGSGKTPEGVPCTLCKQCGWLEIGGAGMVHPNVLKNAGYDPEKVTGFAFGMGLDRMIMIKYRVPHLRLLFENDLRFIRQF